ncbi:DNA translocase FtsK [Spiroplasma clarkii]|nr:DNA translocase FtsK [Spiroplasma clarkii]
MTLSEQGGINDNAIIQSMRDSDITIELPSFVKAAKNENFYVEKPSDFYNGEFKVPENPQITTDYPQNYQQERNYQVGPRGYINVGVDQKPTQNNQGVDPIYRQANQSIYETQTEQNNYQPQPTPNIYENPVNVDFNNPNQPQMFVPKRYSEKQTVNYDEANPNKFEFKDEYIGDALIGKDMSQEEAQKRYDFERNITPYGAGGKTIEMVNDLKATENAKQITIEQMIEQSENEKQIREAKRKQFDEYVNPIEDTFSKTMILQNNGFQPIPSHTTRQVNQVNQLEKEVFVNKNYLLPSDDLLNEIDIDQKSIDLANSVANKKAKDINEVFQQFGVNAKVAKINVGPSVTKFEVLPEPGTKVNAITSLENDLKFKLATKNVLIEAPIQGKAAIGIEVPNDNPTDVPLKAVLERIPFNKMNAKLFFGIGKNVLGEVVFTELDKAPHLLVAGSTGSGKSVMINAIICSILMRAKPHEVKFLMIDPKKVELAVYAPIPHLLAPVISDMAQANSALKKVVNEMDRRYVLFEKFGVKNMSGYNSKVSDPRKQLPYYVIVIDELADLMMTGNKKDVEDSIMRLTQMARAAGIHLIVATQRPSTDVITGVIKTNIPTRISFAVASSIDSRTILDSGGAEKLNGRGDLLFQFPGSNTLVRAQGAFISDEEIHNLVDFVSRQQEQIFDEEFLKTETEVHEGLGSFAKDPMFDEIKEYVIREQKASTSLIQRRFSIGYNRAAKIIDELELAGIIGPQNGAKPREVFVKNQEIY